ncbi:MAG: hypothetical protein DRJ42_31140 [Deltaproteobacteria bacterium]|nr:MAG: hypothetical protein DRJ42_31140 [Deltaproteobacteria bacterium]
MNRIVYLLLLSSSLYACGEPNRTAPFMDAAAGDSAPASDSGSPDAPDAGPDDSGPAADGGTTTDSGMVDAGAMTCTRSSIVTDTFSIAADFAVDGEALHVAYNKWGGVVSYRTRVGATWSPPGAAVAVEPGEITITVVAGVPWIAVTRTTATTIYRLDAGAWTVEGTVASQPDTYPVAIESGLDADGAYRLAILRSESGMLRLTTFTPGAGESTPRTLTSDFDEVNMHFASDGLLGVVWSTSTGAVGSFWDGPSRSPGAMGPITLPDGTTTGEVAINVERAPEFLVSGDDGWSHVSGTSRNVIQPGSTSTGLNPPRLVFGDDGARYAMTFAFNGSAGLETSLLTDRGGSWSEPQFFSGDASAIHPLPGGGVAMVLVTGSTGSKNLVLLECD